MSAHEVGAFVDDGVLVHSAQRSNGSHEQVLKPRVKLSDRLKRKVGGWMLRRLQKRLEREWREYEHAPKVSLGPWLRRRSERGDKQVYRSLVQVHFHPRDQDGGRK